MEGPSAGPVLEEPSGAAPGVALRGGAALRGVAAEDPPGAAPRGGGGAWDALRPWQAGKS